MFLFLQLFYKSETTDIIEDKYKNVIGIKMFVKLLSSKNKVLRGTECHTYG